MYGQSRKSRDLAVGSKLATAVDVFDRKGVVTPL